MNFMYGIGGHGRDCMRLLQAHSEEAPCHFIDDDPARGALAYADAMALKGDEPAGLIVSLADGRLRQRKMQRGAADGFDLITLVAPTAVIGPSVNIGPGALISDYAVLTADITIGAGFHCNLQSCVTHDCEIGDYVTLAPRVTISGRVTVGDFAFLGAGATVLQGRPERPLTIGAGAVIGAHALVTRDVPPGAVVVGAPAREIRRDAAC